MATKKESEAALPEAYSRNSPDAPSSERWITMSNALIRAAHGLSLSEKRIVALAISRLDSRAPVPNTVVVSKITAADFAETFDVALDTAYLQMKSASTMLYKRSISYFEPAFKRRGKPLEPTVVMARWVGSVKYHKGEGWAELHWWPDTIKHLQGLKGHFTQIELSQTTAIRSVYTWKLLELLLRFGDDGKAYYTIEDFQKSMGATPKQCANFALVRRSMIDTPIAELKSKHGWDIECNQIKAGRKVKAVQFIFSKTTQQQLPFEVTVPPKKKRTPKPPKAAAQPQGAAGPTPPPSRGVTPPNRYGETVAASDALAALALARAAVNKS